MTGRILPGKYEGVIDVDGEDQLGPAVVRGDSAAGEYIEIRFRVDIGFGETSTAKKRLYLTDKAAKFSFSALKALGWDGRDDEELTGLGTKACELVIEEREYQGKIYPDIKFINDIKREQPKVARSAEYIAHRKALLAKWQAENGIA